MGKVKEVLGASEVEKFHESVGKSFGAHFLEKGSTAVVQKFDRMIFVAKEKQRWLQEREIGVPLKGGR